MGRQYCKGLTKQDLEDMGIVNVTFIPENNEWIIERDWFRNNSKTIKDHAVLKVSTIVKEHKYGQTKIYPKVQFNCKGKTYAIPLSRFAYAWFIGDIPDGYVIDHIDNDPFNNSIDNLQMLTIEENLAKRYKDNPNAAYNQWSYMDDFDRVCDLFQRHSRRRMKELEKSLADLKEQVKELKGE